LAEYYPVESTHPTEDGGLRVQLRYTGAEWLVRLALGLGAGTRVITPADLAAEVAARAARAVAAYEEHLPYTSGQYGRSDYKRSPAQSPTWRHEWEHWPPGTSSFSS